MSSLGGHAEFVRSRRISAVVFISKLVDARRHHLLILRLVLTVLDHCHVRDRVIVFVAILVGAELGRQLHRLHVIVRCNVHDVPC